MLTPQERLELYQKLLKRFRKAFWDRMTLTYPDLSGFCFALYPIDLKELVELSVQEPFHPNSNYWWSKTSAWGKYKRIQALKKAIKNVKELL